MLNNKQLYDIYLLRFLSTITFGIFFSSMPLLLTYVFGLSVAATGKTVALFFGFHFALPLLGGKIVDVIKKTKFLFLVGKYFQLLSTLLLIYSVYHKEYVYQALSFFLVDSLFSTVTQNMLLTNFFEVHDVRSRQKAFLTGHIWTNLGFVCSFIISGAVYRFIGVNALLHTAALFSFITIIYSVFYLRISDVNYSERKNQASYIFLILTLASVSYLTSKALFNSNLSQELILFFAGIVLLLILCWSLKGAYNKYQNVLKFFVYMLLSMLFWTVYMTNPTFIALFIDKGVDTSFYGFNIPTQWLQVIGPLMILISGFFLAKYLKYQSQDKNNRTTFFIIGIISAFMSMLILMMCLANYSLGTKVSPLGILCCITVISIGEIFIAPASMALVGDYIHKREQGVYSGIIQLNTGMAVLISGFLSDKFLVPAYNSYLASNINYNFMLAVLLLLIVFAILFYIVFDRVLERRNNMIRL